MHAEVLSHIFRTIYNVHSKMPAKELEAVITLMVCQLCVNYVSIVCQLCVNCVPIVCQLCVCYCQKKH